MDELLQPNEAAIRDRIVKAAIALGTQITSENVEPSAVPPTLYHYTSADGLQGIISGAHIRVSRAACLNDPHEISYGERLAGDMLRDRKAAFETTRSRPNLVCHFYEEAMNVREASSGWEVGGVIGLDAFVACFCSEPDLLGQWAYFARDGGYSIGFKSDRLTDTIKPNSFELRQVIYKESDQRRLFESALERFEGLVQKELSGETLAHQSGGVRVAALLFWTVVRALSVQMKAPGFEPESEWRLVTSTLEGLGLPDPDGIEQAKQLGFRTVGSRLVPYCKAEYQNGLAPIVSVTSGPTVDAAIAKNSVTRLLKGKGYPWREIHVGASKLTLRE